MANNNVIDKLVIELTALGCEQVTISELQSMVNEVGYTFDRCMDCRGMTQDMTSGETYPNLTLYPIQADDKKSAWHFEARRDQNYERLQAIRDKYFAVVLHSGTKTFVDF